MDIRPMRIEDIPQVQHCNLTNLPENYFVKYYLYHLVSWPQLSYVAVDVSRPKKSPYDPPKIVGYVLGKMEEDPANGIPNGQITSVSVMRTHRRLGIAERLMRQCQRAMAEVYGAHFVCLHVRQSNKAALHLYTQKLGFTAKRTDSKYYGDKEDASYMQKDIRSLRLPVREGLVVLSAEEQRANADAGEGHGDEGEPVGSLDSAHNLTGGLVEIVERMEKMEQRDHTDKAAATESTAVSAA